MSPQSARRAPLDIEITEGVLLEKTEEVINKLHWIRSMGVQVAIDDFGTGYSSLRYLAHLPIDTLKIDRSFVTAMTEDADDMAIVSSIIALAHGLDLNVVAEGVDTEEQRKLLRLLRCDQMQGDVYKRQMFGAFSIDPLTRLSTSPSFLYRSRSTRVTASTAHELDNLHISSPSCLGANDRTLS